MYRFFAPLMAVRGSSSMTRTNSSRQVAVIFVSLLRMNT